MQTLIEKEKSNLPDWNIAPKDKYNEDDLIDAYLKGVDAGHSKRESILFENLGLNLVKVTIELEKYYKSLKKKMNLRFMRLKINDIDDFEALLVVEEKDFLKDNFSDNYKNVFLIGDLHLDYSFVPATKNLNEPAIESDGYYLKYNG